MRSSGISEQGGSCATAEGEQIVDFLHRARQAIWLNILRFHGRSNLNGNDKGRRIVGERSRFTVPGRPRQSDDGQGPNCREQNQGTNALLLFAFQEKIRQQVLGDDTMPHPIGALRARNAPE